MVRHSPHRVQPIKGCQEIDSDQSFTLSRRRDGVWGDDDSPGRAHLYLTISSPRGGHKHPLHPVLFEDARRWIQASPSPYPEGGMVSGVWMTVPGGHTPTSPCPVLGEGTNTLSTLFNLGDAIQAKLDKPRHYMVHIAELGKSCTMHPDWGMGKHQTTVDAMQCRTYSIVQYNGV